MSFHYLVYITVFFAANPLAQYVLLKEQENYHCYFRLELVDILKQLLDQISLIELSNLEL